VYISLYDQWSTWGTQRYETRWVTASETTSGANGSQHPAQGYAKGVTISEHFGPSETVYGLNGSQDPAAGYVLGTSEISVDSSGSVAIVAGSQCDTSVMMRAFDAQSATWSNMFDLTVGC